MQATSEGAERLHNLKGVLNRGFRGGSRSTLLRDIKAGTFPKPFYINGKMYWKESQLRDWQNNLQTFDEHHAENIDPLTKQLREDADELQAKVKARADAKGFEGYLQTDGYAGYNAVVAVNNLRHVGCMAHARRKFSDAVKAQGRNKKRGKAHRGLGLIQKLYRVEQKARKQKLTPEKRYALRQSQAQPILDEIRVWLNQSLPQVPPSSVTGKALNYMNNEWDKLIRYLQDGRLEIDNNGAENAIRPFVVGRKNFLFSASVKGVNASANLYSLIESAKANGLEPYAYLRYLFAWLPAAQSVEDFEALLPGNIEKNQIQLA